MAASMSEHRSESDEPAGHGVSGTQRGDTQMEEEPTDSPGIDNEQWAEQTETGGQATD
jgi:hypothetical protein